MRLQLHAGALTGIAALTLAALGGCGRAVSIPAPSTDGPAASQCQIWQQDLPPELAGGARLSVTPEQGTTAAWGSPAIVWRCGVAAPDVPPDAQLLTVSGRTWWPEQLSNGARFTSVGTDVPVEITVPTGYPNPAGLLTDLPGG